MENFILQLHPKNSLSSTQIASLKTQLEAKQTELRGLEAKADLQLMEHRTYIERQERAHQKEIDKLQLQFDTQQRLHSDLIGMVFTL